ncbi:MAG TPA: serine hydrolase domain-containing protein [Aliidongia sp.]|uniref:serine hydrolase domain-containing protein n=1 Tax=Aliidongia sp. TaxID=1914230 RepID=UPI002DDD7A5A|nr:serine hydrolase domain-containing protein [Aliidongia sp.]HEV2676069.1 serine hydrolase domain-containing protein [Aliidongia sp.]
MTEDQPQDPVTALDALFARWNRSDEPGLVVGVAHRGKVIYRRGFGLASFESGLANTPKTRMRIASTTKHFAALACLLLAEDGKLDIDASIRTYVPELPALEPEPTLRQLMNHTGGYRCPTDMSFGLGEMTSQDSLDGMVRQTGVNFPAGEQMMYSNGGYELLSLAIERASGQGFAQFLAERIFQPLGMLDTLVASTDRELVPGIATLHLPSPAGGFVRGYLSGESRGSGGIVSTVDDMLIWLAHLRSAKHRVGSEASWAQMLTMTRYANGTVGTYCLGLERETYRGVQTVHHAGGLMGGACQMLTVPAEALDIIIITNRVDGGVNPSAQAEAIVDLLLAEVLAPPEPKIEQDTIARHLGRYYVARTHMLYGLLDSNLFGVPDGAGKLGFSLCNTPGIPVYPMADGAFGMKLSGMAQYVIRPGAAKDGKTQSLDIQYCGSHETALRLPDTPPEPAVAAAGLPGRYYCNDMDATATVTFAQDEILMDVRGGSGHVAYRLNPLTAEVFRANGTDPMLPLIASLAVERANGEAQTLWFDTGRTRHLRFTRL